MRRTAIVLSVAFLAACAARQEYKPPAVELPSSWTVSGPAYARDGQWWRIYGDPALETLVAEALKSNADLVVAAARVDEARALLAVQESYFQPRVDAQAGAGRQQISQRTATAAPGMPREFSSYRGSLNVSYELDLFGRLRASARAARAELESSEASRDAVRLALAAQVAKSYYALQAFDQQVSLTRQTLDLRERALALQRKRFEGGVISEFELRQLEAEAAVVRALLPPLEREREREEAALSVLLGRTPKEVFENRIALAAATDKLSPPVVPAGMPSELLLRRPDIVAAERNLAAADARIAAARAELFPSIALTGALGAESAALGNLFSSQAILWSLAAGVTQPIFAGGRLRAATDAAAARERALVAQYQQAIRTAFGEVRSALAAQARARESLDAENARVEALTHTLRLARLRYDNGISSQLDVLDAERGLLAARIARIEALRAHRAAIADLFRALGG